MKVNVSHALRGFAWITIIALIGLVFAGCPQAPAGPPTAEVTERIAALEDCVQRSDQTVKSAIGAGASAADMRESSNAVADVRAALDDARNLLQQGKNQAAMDRLMKALEECQKIDAMASKARDESLARSENAKQRAAAEAGLARLSTCINNVNQALASAETAGATADELVPAQTALLSAESAQSEAGFLVSKERYKKALDLIAAAEADCRMANDAAVKAGIMAANRSATKPNRYTVQRGDSLWGISGSTPIYGNPFMWPLIYKANRDQIRDPDLIHPNQVFSVPRNYSQEEANSSIQRAKRRGPWRIGDGPDYYILEGVRR